jgi:NADH:ubiquinone oxidoreductase subunit 6 (subunit J)
MCNYNFELLTLILIIIIGLMVIITLNRIAGVLYLILMYILSFLVLLKIGFDLLGLIIILSYAGGVLVLFLIFLIHLTRIQYVRINIKKDTINMVLFFFICILVGYTTIKTEHKETMTRELYDLYDGVAAKGEYSSMVESRIMEKLIVGVVEIEEKIPNEIKQLKELYFDPKGLFKTYRIISLGILLYIVMRMSIQILHQTKNPNIKRQFSIDQIK